MFAMELAYLFLVKMRLHRNQWMHERTTCHQISLDQDSLPSHVWGTIRWTDLGQILPTWCPNKQLGGSQRHFEIAMTRTSLSYAFINRDVASYLARWWVCVNICFLVVTRTLTGQWLYYSAWSALVTMTLLGPISMILSSSIQRAQSCGHCLSGSLTR